jgi:hypothetical protein
MPTELEQIDAKLKSYRATSEKEGRAAQWCRDNRDSDPFQMDGKRQAQELRALLADPGVPEGVVSARPQSGPDEIVLHGTRWLSDRGLVQAR